jgi:hypothetical protein
MISAKANRGISAVRVRFDYSNKLSNKNFYSLEISFLADEISTMDVSSKFCY